MRHSYAVVWSRNGDVGSGRLDPFEDRFELQGRDRRLSVPFSSLARAAILRGHDDRLRGLPVRIASLEGTAALHELADRVEHAGLLVAAA